MYAIDFNTASAVDLIERSLICHPSAFVGALENAQREHASYASANPSTPGHAGAVAAAKACKRIVDYTWLNASERSIAERIANAGTAELSQAVSIAGRLQGIPPYIRAEIAGHA